MFRGMSEKNYRDRFKSDSDKDKQAIEDWMAGSGSKVLGAVIVIFGIWFAVNLFW